MHQFKHQDFESYPMRVEKTRQECARHVDLMGSADNRDYSSGYRAPLLPKNVIQELLDAGFEYHLPANNDSGFWTHPLIAKVLFSTHQAMSRLGVISQGLSQGLMNNSCRQEQHRQWSP
jgi:hypothetical protein